VLAEPVPAALITRAAPPALARRGAAASVLFAGVAIGWIARGNLAPPPQAGLSLARSAANRARRVFAGSAPPVESGRTRGSPGQMAFQAPRHRSAYAQVTSAGYESRGRKIVVRPQGPVAQFMYQDAKGQRLTLYVSAQKGDRSDTAFRFSQEDKVSVFYWIDHKYGYALSGEIKREALLALNRRLSAAQSIVLPRAWQPRAAISRSDAGRFRPAPASASCPQVEQPARCNVFLLPSELPGQGYHRP